MRGVATLSAALLAAACGTDGAVGPETGREITVPILIAPLDGAVLDNGCTDRSDPMEWSFGWSEVPRAQRYHLYVIGPTASIPAVDRELTEPSYAQRSIAYVVDRHRLGWRWRVRALVDGSWGEFSPEGTFDVEPLDTDCPGR
jgi:hypothetical protein